MGATMCVEADGRRNAKGYVRVCVDGRFWYAHRLAWTKANGPIPEGLIVMHLCDNPPCINVDHLALGTKGDNNADMWAKGRGRHNRIGIEITHCKQGHAYTPENTYVRPDGLNPQCRACKREWARRHREEGSSHRIELLAVAR